VIAPVLDAVTRQAGAGDVIGRSEERTTIAFESGRLKAAGVTAETGINVRVVKEGRVGVAGTTATDAPPDDVVARAIASAELGDALTLPFPVAARLPDVRTHFSGAANASVTELTRLGRELMERLTREGCQINVQVEREVASSAFANTAGAHYDYPATGVSIAADVTRVSGDDVLMVYDYWTGADLPTAADLDALVSSIETRLTLGLRIATPPDGSLPVVFTPAGLSAILLPLEQSLSGKAVVQGTSKLAGRVGEQVFDPAFSLSDDPLAPGRAGSRPVDDEGVPAARLALIDRGIVRAFIYDLETAARSGDGARSTGHGRRGTFGKPGIEYTNLVLGTGPTGIDVGAQHAAPLQIGGGLAAEMQDGLVVDDLIGVGQGNVIGGAFSHPVGLAYRVERGEITGRVKDAAVAGNVYDLLKKIGGWGTDGRWLGGRWAPSLLLDGVSVAGR
jgi:PmbA protein